MQTYTRAALLGTCGLGLLSLGAPACAPAASTDVYRGAGAWIDIFDPSVLANAAATVDELSLNGVRTIYVETGNYTNPRYGSIAYPIGIAALLDAAHARGLKVVAWYLPGFLSGMTMAARLSAAST